MDEPALVTEFWAQLYSIIASLREGLAGGSRTELLWASTSTELFCSPLPSTMQKTLMSKYQTTVLYCERMLSCEALLRAFRGPLNSCSEIGQRSVSPHVIPQPPEVLTKAALLGNF